MIKHYLWIRCGFISNPLFESLFESLKYESSIHNIAFSSEKVVHSSRQNVNFRQDSSKQFWTNMFMDFEICPWILMWEDNRAWAFSQVEVLLWIMDSSLKFNGFVSNHAAFRFTTDGLWSCGLLWCFYQLFGLSFRRHPFTAEDPLVM